MDRYRVLWEIYVQGRLSRDGKLGKGESTRLLNVFKHVFARQGYTPSKDVFDAIFNDNDLTHSQLLCWAKEPGTLPGASADAHPTHVVQAEPGTTCPICGFPTYDWYEFAEDRDLVASAIKKIKPTWVISMGVCRQCAETCIATNDEASLAAHAS